MTRRLAALVLLSALGPGAPVAAAQTDSAPAAARSATDGVYASAQAARGEAEFKRTCAGCHVPSQFSGAAFARSWSGRSVYELFSLIRTTMPFDNPGQLSREAYADVVSYLLQLNGYPAGERELPADEGALRRVKFEPPPGD